MNNPSFIQRPVEAGRLVGVARLIRQVCLLREQGDTAQAARLSDNELAVAVRDFRLAAGPAALPEEELRALFALEERRVADAVILSELLIPRLVGNLPATSGLGRNGTLRPTPEPSPVTTKVVAGSPAIPDLLDAMLAAERTGRRPSPVMQRES